MKSNSPLRFHLATDRQSKGCPNRKENNKWHLATLEASVTAKMTIASSIP